MCSSLSELREDSSPPPTYLVEGVKALIGALRTWLKREVSAGGRVLTVIVSVYLHLTDMPTVQMAVVTQLALISWMSVSEPTTGFFLSDGGLPWLCR